MTLAEVIINDVQTDIWPENVPYLNDHSKVFRGYEIDKFY
jgi:hypothetical protein